MALEKPGSPYPSRHLFAYLPVASLLWLTATAFFGGLATPGYSHLSQYMSELGASQAPVAAYVNWLGFMPAQALMVGFLLFSHSCFRLTLRMRAAYPLLLVYALGLALGAIFPCDAGCRPQEPSLSQLIHNGSGLAAYIAGIIAVLLLSDDKERHSGMRSLREWGLFTIATGAFLVMLSDAPYPGLAQRLLELTIYLRIILFAFSLQPGKHGG